VKERPPLFLPRCLWNWIMRLLGITMAFFAVALLSGCASIMPLLGGLSTGGFGGAAVSGAGNVVGGEIAKNEIAWLRQWRLCRKQYRARDARRACMERYRLTR